MDRDTDSYSAQPQSSAQRSPQGHSQQHNRHWTSQCRPGQHKATCKWATRRGHSETQYLDHTLASFHCVCHPEQHPVSQKGFIGGHQPQVCVSVSLKDKCRAQG